ncbi:MAG TPA: glutathionylspermidine synthase family protein [Rudaea sp.]|nr:glutathionylspermidine synthase family protein [Rudaea sp.]
MRRETRTPREGWQQRVESLGFDFHTIDGEPYWREDACYRFTADEVDTLEEATSELHSMCLDAVDRIVRDGRCEELGLDDAAARLAERSWRAGEPALYGRMDLVWDGSAPPKLLEYNADTPTALFEASVVQWYWLKDVLPEADQFNSVHEKLVARWKEVYTGGKIHFAACYGQPEDRATCEYLRDTAVQGGIETVALDIEEIGWSGGDFIDLDDRVIATLFKLYPWEWLLDETFGKHVPKVGVRFIEPAWKMLLSNKSILPLLWELYPDHPNLLPASHRRADLSGEIVRKPRHGREGEGIVVLGPGIDEPPPAEAAVYQQFRELPRFGDRYMLIGSWIVGHDPAGIGIREDLDRITRNTSCFVPHYFVD